MLDILKPKNVNHKKVRLGPPEDGGYVMPEIVLEQYSALFTYGVGHDIRYEEEFVSKYKKPAYLFDHTLGRNSQTIRENLYFYNEGLGFSPNCKDVTEHYNNLNIQGSIFLKIDIEGGEYDYFSKVDIEKIASIANGLSLEVHWISGETNRNNCFSIVNKINSHFTLCHVHGNNWGGLFDYEGHKVPETLELSFINKQLVQTEEIDNQIYPIEGLDISNNPNIPDYPLTFINSLV